MPCRSPFFTGRHDRMLDHELGVRLPCEWRGVPGDKSCLHLGSRRDLPMIEVLPEQEFRDRLKQIDDLDWAAHDEKRAAKDLFAAKCRPATVNGQGKLLVPEDWCRTAGLAPGGRVTLAGRGRYYEVWNPGNFETAQEREAKQLQELDDLFGIL